MKSKNYKKVTKNLRGLCGIQTHIGTINSSTTAFTTCPQRLTAMLLKISNMTQLYYYHVTNIDQPMMQQQIQKPVNSNVLGDLAMLKTIFKHIISTFVEVYQLSVSYLIICHTLFWYL